MPFDAVDTPRSVLFVPGSDAKRVAAAGDSAADLVVFDLEHSEDTFGEGPAGERVAEALATRSGDNPVFGVRVHGIETTKGVTDLDAIRATTDRPEFVVLPDVTGPRDVTLAEEFIADTDVDIFALIEDPVGVFEAREIVTATPRLVAVAFGPSDFASYMGISDGVEPDFSVPRYLVSMAANSAGLTAVDMPNLGDVDDETLTRREAEAARSMGYDAKIAISESQVRIVNDVFGRSPTGAQP